eukprot:SAG31_NODE_5240_length_2656_cov_4.684005_3_plen_172_part_00
MKARLNLHPTLAQDVSQLIELTFGQRLSAAQLSLAEKAMDAAGTGHVNYTDFASWSMKEVSDFRTKDSIGAWSVVVMQELSMAGGELELELTRLLRQWFREADVEDIAANYGTSDGHLNCKQIVNLLGMLNGAPLNQVQIDHAVAVLDPDGKDSIAFIPFRNYFFYEFQVC